jgi:hypothetical protein
MSTLARRTREGLGLNPGPDAAAPIVGLLTLWSASSGEAFWRSRRGRGDPGAPPEPAARAEPWPRGSRRRPRARGVPHQLRRKKEMP